jgi:type IV pilus assembly protein PilF
MKRTVIAILCLGLVMTACQTTNENAVKEAAAHRKLGEAFLLDDNYVAALRELTTAQQLDPDNPIVYNDIGLVYMNRDKLPEALTYFQKALSIKPDYSDALLNIAVTHLKMGEWDAAIERLKSLESDMLYAAPQNVALNLGYAYYMKGQYADAFRNYERAIKHYEDGFKKDITYVRAMLGNARVSIKMGNPKAALGILDAALLEAPMVPELHFYRGAALELLGQSDEARNAYLRVIELAPQGDLSKQAVAALRAMTQ